MINHSGQVPGSLCLVLGFSLAPKETAENREPAVASRAILFTMTDVTAPSAASGQAEEVLWSGSVSHWHYAGKWFFILLLVAAAVATFFVKPVTDESTLWFIRGSLAAVALVLFGWVRLDRIRRKYIVTNKRVSVEFGIVSKQCTELRIQDIRSINLTRTGFSGLAGIGRLEFSSAATDDADVIFWNTPSAEKIRDMVRSLQSLPA